MLYQCERMVVMYRLKLKILHRVDGVEWISLDTISKEFKTTKDRFFLAIDELGVAGYIEQKDCKYIRTVHLCSVNLYKKRHREKVLTIALAAISVLIALTALIWDIVGLPPFLDSAYCICHHCIANYPGI